MGFEKDEVVWLVPPEYWNGEDPVRVTVRRGRHNHPPDPVLDTHSVWVEPVSKSSRMKPGFVDARLLFFDYANAKAAQLLMCMLRDNRLHDDQYRRHTSRAIPSRGARWLSELVGRTLEGPGSS
jgi:hypothetical protein